MSAADSISSAQIAHLQTLVSRLGDQMQLISGQITTVQNGQQQTRTELQQLRDEFLRFVRQAEFTANIQRAETRIGAIQGRVDQDFGHYRVVRRTAVGLLQAFDLGLVSEDNVRNISDQLMIQTPRYWLAPALVALASWAADDRTLCEKAVDEAFRRAPDRTSLFFALVLRRQNRGPSAVRWLRHYLLAQDPAALGREFAVIMEAIAQGAFGAAGRDMLNAHLAGWREDLLTNEETLRKQITRWRHEIDALTPASAAAEFPRLSQVSPQWTQLDSVLSRARTHQVVLTKYSKIMEQEFRPSARIEDAVDDILDQLVREFDSEELPLRRELAFNEAVIARHGDMAAAKADAEGDAASYQETLDYLTVQSTAALNPSAIGASAATQRLSVAACHDWFLQAHAGFSRDYRAAVPPDVEAHFATSYTVASRTFQLPPWRGSFLRPLGELEPALAAHWDQHMAPFVAALAFAWEKKALPLIGAVLLVLLIVCQIDAAVGVFMAAAVGGVWYLVLRGQAAKAGQLQQNARTALENAKRESLHALRGASAELTDWRHKYQAADAVEPQCRQFIGSLATAVHAASPYEGRVVSPEASR